MSSAVNYGRKATGGKESLGEGMGGRVNFLGACGGSET
jgi:hypothetical protein